MQFDGELAVRRVREARRSTENSNSPLFVCCSQFAGPKVREIAFSCRNCRHILPAFLSKRCTLNRSLNYRLRPARLNMSAYRVRSLDRSEVDSWLDFVHGVFAEAKGAIAPPRSYFERHIENDPGAIDSISENVIVAVDEQNRFIGTLRLFRRRLYLNDSVTSAGGIGEVCVRSDHRRRGVATLLLEHAVERLSNAGVELSFLHTSTSESIYRSMGWVSVPQRFVELIRQPAHDHRGHIEQLHLESDDDIHRCSMMYKDFCYRFDGCVVRDQPEYWRKWVQAESGGVAWSDPNLTPVPLRTINKEAYAVLQSKGDAIRVREFVVLEKGMKRAGLYLDAFLSKLVAPEQHTVSIILAEPLLSVIGGSPQIVNTFTDTGQMYRRLGDNSSEKHLLPREERHVFWATDAF
ncbi:hypothetical protein CCYA_CCYA18G4547 [Cyanidiococcus yangmingshanensis]|nr:hypothetical protein CCYA_CCYA18G4547 [Cyanidiococcus yangmingshanensis]